ncbi:hypothetical protein EMIHUDRAFT_114529 [Emiliania huxleyi CCMP1516]|uniref:Uncharacterized protein n=2 Tax=Emiliania huxleyi TaxID=2903 RepID=A0A0D3JVP4_EMIH1|nr:hypothetical protein EMIHUDRAFT_114529 [Emiliania huxleyi CCMP1516]EOD27579.1 hypothetical protein EMIHUDRAFT_114529 [Emiliania huxleyi CCMP1516]|eukprot:XP_005780008.1 hypothetical protein EMIHUDRAFT_114529 [Emiliania huxleyi CCMP1516]
MHPWDRAQIAHWLVETCCVSVEDASAYADALVSAGFDSPLALSVAQGADWPAVVRLGHQRVIQHMAGQQLPTPLPPPPSPPPSPPMPKLPLTAGIVAAVGEKATEGAWDLGRRFRPRQKLSAPAYTAAGLCRVVRVRAVVERLLNIDLKGMTFTADLKYEASWTDGNILPMLRKLQPEDDPLQETGSSGESEADRAERQRRQEKRLNDLLDDSKSGQKDLYFTGLEGERFFAPRLYFRNLASGETETWLKIYLDPSCDDSVVVCLSSKCTGTFQEQFELEHFPFDEQDLTMEMASEHAREDGSGFSVQLERNDNDRYRSFVITRGFLQSSSYTLKERLRFTRDTTPPSESNSGKTYPLLQIGMRVQRHSFFWIFSVVVPLFFLTTALATSFVVNEDEFADRASITLTALLAIVAFQPVIADRLPDDCNTMTLVDLYVFICFAFAFILIMVQSVNAMYVNSSDTDFLEPTYAEEIGGKPYRISSPFVVTICVWVGFHLFIGLYVYMIIKWRRSRSKFWKSQNNVLWLGPLNADLIGPRDERTSSDKDETKKKVEQIICSRLRELPALRAQGHHVKGASLWNNEDAQEQLRQEHDKNERLHLRLLDCLLRLDGALARLLSPTAPKPSSTCALVVMDTARGAEALLDLAKEEPERWSAFVEAVEMEVALATAPDERAKALLTELFEKHGHDWTTPDKVKETLEKLRVSRSVAPRLEQLKSLEVSEERPPSGTESRPPLVKRASDGSLLSLSSRHFKPTTGRVRLEALNPSWISLLDKFRPLPPRREPLLSLGPLASSKLCSADLDIVWPSGGVGARPAYLEFSEVAAVTIPRASRAANQIPEEATHFAYVSIKSAMLVAGEEARQPRLILPHGGFAYWSQQPYEQGEAEDSQRKICRPAQVTRITEGPGMSFHRRVLTKEEHGALKDYQLLPVTLPSLRQIKVRRFCWIPPTCPRAGKTDCHCVRQLEFGSALICPHGGFAYTYSCDNNKHTKKFDCVFRLKPSQDLPPVRSECISRLHQIDSALSCVSKVR